ncbi:uncharacterized protein LOC126584237 [Malus sylvestris]|uniref:uncharacterized protein LOC126584237 n=1 Tax=Malus sylvestris TaxID=3752 RepID=UPI0021AD2791|nr:uncharacterized protein LOC126584237 [Malus sylvestris]
MNKTEQPSRSVLRVPNITWNLVPFRPVPSRSVPFYSVPSRLRTKWYLIVHLESQIYVGQRQGRFHLCFRVCGLEFKVIVLAYEDGGEHTEQRAFCNLMVYNDRHEQGALCNKV